MLSDKFRVTLVVRCVAIVSGCALFSTSWICFLLLCPLCKLFLELDICQCHETSRRHVPATAEHIFATSNLMRQAAIPVVCSAPFIDVNMHVVMGTHVLPVQTDNVTLAHNIVNTYCKDAKGVTSSEHDLMSILVQTLSRLQMRWCIK